MCPFEKLQDVLLEVRTRVDVGLIEECLSPAGLNLASDLARNPCVRPAMADEHQPPLVVRGAHVEAIYSHLTTCASPAAAPADPTNIPGGGPPRLGPRQQEARVE